MVVNLHTTRKENYTSTTGETVDKHNRRDKCSLNINHKSKDLVHVQRGFDHLLVLNKVRLQVSERRDERRIQQNLVATCNTHNSVSTDSECTRVCVCVWCGRWGGTGGYACI